MKSELYWVPGQKISITWGRRTAEVALDADQVAAKQQKPRRRRPQRRTPAPNTPSPEPQVPKPTRWPMPPSRPGIMAFLLLTRTGRLKAFLPGEETAFRQALVKAIEGNARSRRSLYAATPRTMRPKIRDVVVNAPPRARITMPDLERWMHLSRTGVVGICLLRQGDDEV